jgi:hypothetical protein
MYTPQGGVEITQGLAPGEVLVVQGFEALSEGAPVKISSRTTLQAAESAAAAAASGTPTASGSPSGAAPLTSAHAQGSAHPAGPAP